jgi:hypothetical protein
VPNSQYVLTLSAASSGGRDLSSLRGDAIADAHVRFRRMTGDDVLFEPEADAATIERWGQWLLGKLDAADGIYQRSGEGWRLRSGKLHAENERRLDELSDWSDKALAGQRELLKHVDDPGDSGNELEQSLSKLAAAGWKVDSKKDKGPPTIFYAAGDMPLSTGEDWRASGSLHPRFAAALGLLVATLPPDARDGDPDTRASELAARLPALAVAGEGANAALLDLRTIAKALRDAGALELANGEPVAPALLHGSFKLRAVKRKRAASANGASAAPPPAPLDPSDVDALIAAHGDDALRFALLHAAAPQKRFSATDDILGYTAGFLRDLREFAATRLDGATAGARIDGSDGLRWRLAGWCDMAVARSTENHEQLDLHRATRNAVTLFARIKDFDARVVESRGEATGADREAVGAALEMLALLLAPLAPAAADELWQATGNAGSPGDAAWPNSQREPAAA